MKNYNNFMKHENGNLAVGFIKSKKAEYKVKYMVVPVEVEMPFKLQGTHKTEQRAEDVYHYMKYYRKSKVQRKKDRLERLQKKQLQRQLQKQRIKRENAKVRRAGAEAKTAKETFVSTSNTATGIAQKLQEIAAKNKSLIMTKGIFALLFIMIISSLSCCGSMFIGTVTTTLAGTYLSLPAEIAAVDLSFTRKEMTLQNTIDSMETDHSEYDEYDYNLGAIGHDPFTLISYLSAVYTEFTAADVENEIQELFNAMYSITTEKVAETRTRTVTKTGTRTVTDAEGNPVLDADSNEQTEEYEYEEEEEYTVTILRVTLTVTPLESIVAGRMDSEKSEIFAAYTETKGRLQVFRTHLDYYISSYYGCRKKPNTGAEELHRGVDIAMPTQLEEAQTKLSNVEHQLETAKAEVNKPFAQEAELSEKLYRLTVLNALLNMDEKGNDAIGMDGEIQESEPERKLAD